MSVFDDNLPTTFKSAVARWLSMTTKKVEKRGRRTSAPLASLKTIGTGSATGS